MNYWSASVCGKDWSRTGCFAYRSFGLDGTIPWLAFVPRYEGKCCVTELNKIQNAARNLGINLRQKMTKVVLLKVNTFSDPNASKLERAKTM